MTTRWIMLLSLSAILLPGIPGLARQTIPLDGEWECVFGDPKSLPPADAAWEPVIVPSTRAWRSEGPHALWYRKLFYLPPGWAGRRILLTIGGAKYYQRVYLNGNEVGQHLGGFEQTQYDLSNRVLLGQANEILVAVQDWTALVAPGAQMVSPERSTEFASWVKDSLLAPLGSRGWEVGIWGSVSVDARPRVWIEDVFVAPSVRERMLRVEVTLRNGSASQEATIVTARIASGGGGPRLEPQLATTVAGEVKTIAFEAPWPNPRFWSPEDPHLYSVVVGARTGAIGDSQEVTFGFREFWQEGDRFLLNGVPINLLATAAQPMSEYDSSPTIAYEMAKSAGATAMRLGGQPWPSQWYHVADALGMLLVAESALWRLSSSYALAQEQFWENAQGHISALVKALRNHPSVIIWSAGNELLYSGGAKIAGVEQKVAALADLVREADPTRPVMFEGDADPAGKADIINLHYPRELAHSGLWPRSAYSFDGQVGLRSHPGAGWRWDRKKPLYLGEFGHIPLGDTNSASVLFGDAAFSDAEVYRARAEAALWEMQIGAARDLGIAGMSPWSIFEMTTFPSPQSEAQERAYSPIAVFIREAGARVFSGTVVDRTLVVVNDTALPRSLELHWRLTPAEGNWEVGDSAQISIGPAVRQQVQAYLAVPASDAEMMPATFVVELWEGRQQLCASSQSWKVYARSALSAPIKGAPAEVALYDPGGETRAVLSRLGIKCLDLDAGDAWRDLHFTPVAVVGKGALDAAGEGERAMLATLSAFVQAGGTLLVFEQNRYPRELIPVSLTEYSSTIAFPRFLGHPTLAEVEAELSHWVSDDLVAEREILVPARGGFLPLVDSGSARGLASAALAELRVGNGRMILCQLDVTSKFQIEPAAIQVLRNLLAYTTTSSVRPGRTGVFSDDHTAAALDSVGLVYDRLRWPLPKGALRHYDALLICNLEAGISEPARIQQFVRDGGRVLLHRAIPESIDIVQLLTGQPLALEPLSSGSIFLEDRNGPAAALSNQELAWFSPASPTGDIAPALTTDIAEYGMHEAAMVAAMSEPALPRPTYHTIPGLLVSSQLGRGLWVMDQVKWEQAGPNEEKAKRYLATLLTNLGCQFDWREK